MLKQIYIIILIIALVAAGFLIFNKKQTTPIAPHSVHNSTFASNQFNGRIVKHDELSNHRISDANPSQSPDPLEKYFGNSASIFCAEVQTLLRKALYGAITVEIEMRLNSTSTLNPAYLQGLQRKLFMEDIYYASLVTGKIDRACWGDLYTNMVHSLSKTDLPELKAFSNIQSQ